MLVYDPRGAGRFDLYKESMRQLLHPKERGITETLTDHDVVINLGLRTWDGKSEKPLVETGMVKVPRHSHAGFLNGFEQPAIDDFPCQPRPGQAGGRLLDRHTGSRVCAAVRWTLRMEGMRWSTLTR